MIDNKIINYANNLLEKLNIDTYLGIIVYGSYIGKRNDYLSDLDVMIIKDKYDTQDCGSMMIDGIRVEYFIQDLKRLYQLIKMEIDNNDPSHLTKFATCRILYDKDNQVQEFINYATELYNTKIKKSFNEYDKFGIFSINNRMEDLESLINHESFYSVYFIVLEKIRTLYCHINGFIDLPIMKIEKLYTNKDYACKYISSKEHNLPDEKFINLYLQCLIISDKKAMFNKINELFNYSFSNLEFNPTNFVLQFKNNAPFKV